MRQNKFNACIAKRIVYPLAKIFEFRQVRYPLFGEWIYIMPRSILLHRISVDGGYEQQNIAILKALLPPLGLFYDIGANYGIVSLAIAVAKPDCSILSIEPSSLCITGLCRTICSLNRSRWEVVKCALGTKDGEAVLITSEDGQDAYGGLGNTRRISGQVKHENVALKKLDSLWIERGREKVDLIKIDVEGMEIDVLKGGEHLLASCRPYVLLEISRCNLLPLEKSHVEIIQFATDHGYRLLNAKTMEEAKSPDHLKHQMIISEDFLMIPC